MSLNCRGVRMVGPSVASVMLSARANRGRACSGFPSSMPWWLGRRSVRRTAGRGRARRAGTTRWSKFDDTTGPLCGAYRHVTSKDSPAALSSISGADRFGHQP